MQDQLLDLQHNLHKTIVFITHDLDEALKLGDHIAILKDGELRQFGGPEEILLRPADDYVTSFVQDVNRGRVVTIGSICTQLPVITAEELTIDRARSELSRSHEGAVYVVDADGRPTGVITDAVLERADSDDWLAHPGNLPEPPSAQERTVIERMLPMVDTNDIPVAVLDREGRFRGAVSRHTAISALAKSPEELREEFDAQGAGETPPDNARQAEAAG
jgi:glycine betaine/proline transport system ATP-binding protein